MAKPLSDRIRSALLPTSRLPDTRATLADAQAALKEAESNRTAAEERRLDITLSDAEQAQAQADYEESHLDALRLARAVDGLKARIADIENLVAKQQRKDAHEAMVARRDKLAADISERVPGLLDELMSFIDRIKLSNAEIEGSGLKSAEWVGRGIDWYVNGCPASSLTAIKLPRFDGVGHMQTNETRRSADMHAQVLAATARDLEAARLARTPEARAEAASREEARWARYEVCQRVYRGSPVTDVSHRHGVCWVGQKAEHRWMDAGQVKAARAKGLLVEPAPEAEAA
jgi:hypothetical protein